MTLIKRIAGRLVPDGSPSRNSGVRDARLGQIACLTALLAFGLSVFRFDISALHPPVMIAAALLTQFGFSVALKLRFDPLSPIITALSLSLLLRADALWLSAFASALAVATKFLIRIDGRHIYNPANFSLVIVPWLTAGAWISPGQWGAAGLLAVAIAGAGALVAGRAARLDTTLSFLGVWAALAFGRALWFGDPMAIPLHQLQSGALLVFAFFMISDPATTPPTRALRIVHAAAVAGLGFALQFFWITNAGAIMALMLLAPIVPLLTRCADRWRALARKETSCPMLADAHPAKP